MQARAVQRAHPYSCVRAKVFTKIFASISMQSLARFVSHGHPMVGLLVGDGIVFGTVFSDGSRNDVCHGQKRS